MNQALRQFQKLADLSITSSIDWYRQTGNTTRKMTIGVRDLGVERVTSKLRSSVEQYCKSIKVDVVYSEPARAFNIDIDLDKVVMTSEQATAHVAVMKSRKEAA